MELKFFSYFITGAVLVVLTGCSCASPFKRGENIESASESYLQPMESIVDSVDVESK
jgi:hypothetical protein